MKSITNLLICAFTLVSCQPSRSTKAIDALHRDVVKITQDIADIRVELRGVRGGNEALSKENAILRERVRELELNAYTGSSVSRDSVGGGIVTPAPAASDTATSPPRRGGFTDWGESTRAVTSVPAPAAVDVSAAPSVRETPPAPITRDPAIIDRCSQEWKTDFKMVAFCQEKQQSAKNKLDRGNLYGISGMGFDTIRRDCMREWGTDYSMRVYCEEKQAAAYKLVNRQ